MVFAHYGSVAKEYSKTVLPLPYVIFFFCYFFTPSFNMSVVFIDDWTGPFHAKNICRKPDRGITLHPTPNINHRAPSPSVTQYKLTVVDPLQKISHLPRPCQANLTSETSPSIDYRHMEYMCRSIRIYLLYTIVDSICIDQVYGSTSTWLLTHHNPASTGNPQNSMPAIMAVKKAFRKTVKQGLRNLDGEVISMQCKLTFPPPFLVGLSVLPQLTTTQGRNFCLRIYFQDPSGLEQSLLYQNTKVPQGLASILACPKASQYRPTSW